MPFYDGRNYETGTYLMVTRKIWPCQCCHNVFPKNTLLFTRVQCFGNKKINKFGQAYQEKVYTRFCIPCALGLPDLNAEEKVLLGNEYFKNLDKYKNVTPILLDKC
jgi:hypothetical protein